MVLFLHNLKQNRLLSQSLTVDAKKQHQKANRILSLASGETSAANG